jgi:hypothetical protein
MINSNSINFRFYKIIESEDLLEHGKYKAFDTPYDAPEFDWGRSFFIITDEDYITHKIEEADLLHRIDHIAINGSIQIIYCPPVKEDLESIYIMTPDIRITGVYSSYVLDEGFYKGRKVGYHFFTSNKETHRFSQEELVERVCSGGEEKAFKEKVKDYPDIVINDKGCVVRFKKSDKADGIRKFLGKE